MAVRNLEKRTWGLRLSLIVLVAASIGCSTLRGNVDPTQAAIQEPGDYEGMDLDALGAHLSRFTLAFEGERSWTYRVEHRQGDEAVERTLHIEGVSDARNPGDIRMVTREQESRMRGPGTDDQCLRFPASMEMNVTFLGPDDVMPPAEFREPLVPIGVEQVAGRESVHHALLQAELGRWEQVRLGLWLQSDSGALLRYDLAASGFDPYFGAGYGTIEGLYQVLELGPQQFEPIQGCEINLPLPPSVVGLVRLPGVIAFETSMSLDETVTYYRQALEQADWQPLSEEERGSGAVVISYRRGTERLDVTLRALAQGTRVELLTNE